MKNIKKNSSEHVRDSQEFVFAKVYHNLAIEHHEAGRFQDAEHYYLKSMLSLLKEVKANPGFAGYYFLMQNCFHYALILQQNSLTQQALDFYEKAFYYFNIIEFDSIFTQEKPLLQKRMRQNYLQAKIILAGDIYLEDPTKSLPYYLEVLAEDKLNLIALNQVGMCYSHNKEFSKALSYFKQAATLTLNDPDVLINLGYCYKELRKFKMANAYITKALTMTLKDSDRTLINNLLAEINNTNPTPITITKKDEILTSGSLRRLSSQKLLFFA